MVRRKVNGLADYLANVGVENQDREWDRCWKMVDFPILKEKCLQLAKRDLDVSVWD